LQAPCEPTVFLDPNAPFLLCFQFRKSIINIPEAPVLESIVDDEEMVSSVYDEDDKKEAALLASGAKPLKADKVVKSTTAAAATTARPSLLDTPGNLPLALNATFAIATAFLGYTLIEQVQGRGGQWNSRTYYNFTIFSTLLTRIFRNSGCQSHKLLFNSLSNKYFLSSKVVLAIT
jgi:hypothetical protein